MVFTTISTGAYRLVADHGTPIHARDRKAAPLSAAKALAVLLAGNAQLSPNGDAPKNRLRGRRPVHVPTVFVLPAHSSRVARGDATHFLQPTYLGLAFRPVAAGAPCRFLQLITTEHIGYVNLGGFVSDGTPVGRVTIRRIAADVARKVLTRRVRQDRGQEQKNHEFHVGLSTARI